MDQCAKENLKKNASSAEKILVKNLKDLTRILLDEFDYVGTNLWQCDFLVNSKKADFSGDSLGLKTKI